MAYRQKLLSSTLTMDESSHMRALSGMWQNQRDITKRRDLRCILNVNEKIETVPT